MKQIAIYWFRRDLRLNDNVALYHALSSDLCILPIFIFDTNILEQLANKSDRRVDYIHQALHSINQELKAVNSSLLTYHGTPEEVFKNIFSAYKVTAVYFNEDYEPYALKRDKAITSLLFEHNINVHSYCDHVIFSPTAILKKDNTPYKVYTPYAKQWRSQLNQSHYKNYTKELDKNSFFPITTEILSLSSLGFVKTSYEYVNPTLKNIDIANYDKTRDYPASDTTSKLGIALRFGTISVRSCVLHALKHNDVWLSQLIWREFFIQIMYHFSHVELNCFKEAYESMPYSNNEEHFKLWCEGNTGYPLVDAGIRELLATGFMHNRVRMVVSSFLTKHLLIDWRWGEAFFALHLNDFELASNNGNWQWVAGCGCDASPYFRIFNPIEQMKKFDPKGIYTNKWLPKDYKQKPIVDHKEARQKALNAYEQMKHLNWHNY